jgi:small subunit ribosomal protein S1
VDLGGVDGLLHVSDMSWSQVDRPSDVVSPGQEVEVMVLKIKTTEDGRERISLGLKQVTPDPWNNVAERYSEGTQLKARIVRVVDFGAFAEVEEGVEALIPVSEMSWNRVSKPKAVVRVGDIVDTVVIRVEPGRRRMALSMKQASPDPWSGVDEEFEKDSVVTGRVTKIADFGAFVELRAGVEGLVHISELSPERVRTPSEVVQVGQEVTAKVLNVDMDQRRVSLSLKAALLQGQDASVAPETGKVPKKRKKPLRGGMGSGAESGLFGNLLS